MPYVWIEKRKRVIGSIFHMNAWSVKESGRAKIVKHDYNTRHLKSLDVLLNITHVPPCYML
jgi:hypothetical protein